MPYKIGRCGSDCPSDLEHATCEGEKVIQSCKGVDRRFVDLRKSSLGLYRIGFIGTDSDRAPIDLDGIHSDLADSCLGVRIHGCRVDRVLCKHLGFSFCNGIQFYDRTLTVRGRLCRSGSCDSGRFIYGCDITFLCADDRWL